MGTPSKMGNLAWRTAFATHAPVRLRLCAPVAVAAVTCPLGATANLTVTVPVNCSASRQLCTWP